MNSAQEIGDNTAFENLERAVDLFETMGGWESFWEGMGHFISDIPATWDSFTRFLRGE